MLSRSGTLQAWTSRRACQATRTLSLTSLVLVGASWTGLCPEFVALSRAGKLQAWNLPLGVLSHLVRDCGAGRPGTLTRIGLATFVDPRERGGKVSGPHQADVVQARALLPQTPEQVQSRIASVDVVRKDAL